MSSITCPAGKVGCTLVKPDYSDEAQEDLAEAQPEFLKRGAKK